ncbi:MAG: hypothetical protein D6706_18550, partial [Chloroflexi bacterium]
FTAVPDGVAAGQYAIINGEQYPIVATTATTVTLEYSALLADPTGTPVVQFALWRFAGKYRGLSSYSRASRRTYIDPLTGQVTGAPAGFPAFERMADGGIGILLEGSSTNYLLDSQNFAAANWGKQGCTVAAATGVIGPDGSTNCYTITDDVTNGYHRIYQTVASIPAGSQTAYAIVKAGTMTQCSVMMRNPTDGQVALAYFDLTNGTITSVISGSAKIVPLANGWYWCEVYGTGTAASNVYIGIASAGTTFYTGAGTGTVHIWHAQGEPMPFGTSVIPTTTTTVTRAADDLYFTGTGNITDKFTIIADVEFEPGQTAEPRVFGTRNGTSYIRTFTSNWNVKTTGANSLNFYHPSTIYDGQTHRLAFVFDNAQRYGAIWENGILRVQNTALVDNVSLANLTSLGVGSY